MTIKDQRDVQQVLSRERRLVEVLHNHLNPMTVEQIAAYADEPLSSTYRSIKRLKEIGVLIEGKAHVVTDRGRNATRSTYLLDRERALNYSAPLEQVGELPQYYNHLSKQLYSLLDFAARFDPGKPVTGGVKASASYLEVATLLLSLALDQAGAESVENLKMQLALRSYLQQALPAVRNTVSQIEQMLDDPRIWSKELYVLAANPEVMTNAELIQQKASQINIV
jgi:hypothetical protein